MLLQAHISDSKRERFPDWAILKIAGLAAASAAAVLLFCFNPESASFYPPCPLHALTGLFCPGCGSTRALYYLLHGNVLAALKFNPLMVLSLPVLGYFYFRRSLLYRPAVAWIAFFILVLYGVLRNIPFWPFTHLAPG